MTERLFIAVPVGPERAGEIGAWQAGSGLPGAPVPLANLHFTIRFLGDLEAEQRDRVAFELGAADLGGRFTVKTGPIGAFAKPAKASVVWLGLATGEEDLRGLFDAVDLAVDDAGLGLEDRPFRAHLTVSRLRPPGDVRSFTDAASAVSLRIAVDRVVLFRSSVGRDGVRYDEIDSFELA